MTNEEILARIGTLKMLWEHNESCMIQNTINPNEYYKQLVCIDRECDKLEEAILCNRSFWYRLLWKIKNWLFEEV